MLFEGEEDDEDDGLESLDSLGEEDVDPDPSPDEAPDEAATFAFESPDSDESFLAPELEAPLAADDDERESVTYQPLPLNTMPTG